MILNYPFSQKLKRTFSKYTPLVSAFRLIGGVKVKQKIKQFKD
jgi:hypothetical protein